MPSPPQNVEVIAKTSRVVNISWTPGFNGNSDILNYTVEISTDNQTFAQATCPGISSSGCVVSSSFTNASLVGLHPGRTYYIRVFATNNVGSGTSSSVITTTTDEEGIMSQNFCCFTSLKKHPAFCEATTTGFPQNDCRNAILMTGHYPDLGCSSDWLCPEGICFSQSLKHYPDLDSDTSLVRSFCAYSSDSIPQRKQWLGWHRVVKLRW